MAKPPSVHAFTYDGHWYIGWLDDFGLEQRTVHFRYGYHWAEYGALVGTFDGERTDGGVVGKWTEEPRGRSKVKTFGGTSTFRLVDDAGRITLLGSWGGDWPGAPKGERWIIDVTP
jgi:hypothetical protein